MISNNVVTHEKWLKARLELLDAEKEFTRQRDALTLERELEQIASRFDRPTADIVALAMEYPWSAGAVR